jgi:hypothetical protein
MHLSPDVESALAWLGPNVVGHIERGLVVEDAGVVGITIAR